MQKITPCLWFDDKAEEAVTYYISIFKMGVLKKFLTIAKKDLNSIKNQQAV